MKIKNISTAVVLLAGVLINPNQVLTNADFGVDFNYVDYKQEFLAAYSSNKIIFLDNNNQTITNINVISTLLSNSSSVPSTSIDSIMINKENFYYDYKTITLKYGEVKDIHFVGYLKTLDFIVDLGLIDVQIISPLMNKIEIFESNTYTLDTDYKLKDPIIRITAKTDSTSKIYLDGIFFSSTKTKEQYLNEIYSYDYFPSTSLLPENKLVFKTNFYKLLKTSYFLDTISHKRGRIYNGQTLHNFNKFQDSASVKFPSVMDFKDNDFTFCLWFNLGSDYVSKQCVFHEHNNLDIVVENSTINLTIGDYRLSPINLSTNSTSNWFLISISKTNKTYNIYINSDLVQTIDHPTDINHKNYMYFGHYDNCGIRSGYLGECLIYNYHLSTGMIKYIYANNHPDLQVQTNLIAGSNKNIFSFNSALLFDNSYEFSIAEKENAKVSNLLSTFNDTTLSGTCSKLTIITGKVHIPNDGKYTFTCTTDAKYRLQIDNRDVLVNNTNDVYIEEGYYNFKLTLINGSTYTSEIPLIEDINNNTVDPVLVIDADNSIGTGMVFSTANVYVNNIGTITNLPSTMSNIFTITANFKFYSNDTLIFQIGSDIWNPTIGLKVSGGTLECDFHWSNMKSGITKTVWHNVVLTSNGSTLFGYLDGHSMGQFDVDVSSLNTSTPLYFNAFADGTQPAWAIGNFDINNFKMYSKYSNESEALALFSASGV